MLLFVEARWSHVVFLGKTLSRRLSPHRCIDGFWQVECWG